MARPLRIEFDGAWYHVMNRGAGRRRVFRSRAHRETFLELLGTIRKTYSIETHGYCLMGNHYHLLLRTPVAGLSRGMRHLDGVYAQRFNRSMRSDGPLFRGRYKSVLIERDEHVCQVSRYIHLNPVSAGIVARPETYEFSSYAAFIGLEPPPFWLVTSEILLRFPVDDARERYREFVERGVDSETQEFFARPRRPPVMGSATFRKQIRQRVLDRGPTANREIPQQEAFEDRPSLAEIAVAVGSVFALAPSELPVSRGRRDGAGPARGALVHLAREIGGHSLSDIADWVGYRSYASASKAMDRFRRRMLHDRDLLQRERRARQRLARRTSEAKT